MHMLRQIDPELHREVLRNRERVWIDLAHWLGDAWTRVRGRPWRVEVPIRVDEVLTDLAYGRE